MKQECTTAVPDTATSQHPSGIRFENVRASFPDGGEVRIEERDLETLLPRATELNLDAEYNYIVVGMNWREPSLGLVQLPSDLCMPIAAGGEVQEDEYDRAAHIDRAIEALQRAKALLALGAVDLAVTA